MSGSDRFKERPQACPLCGEKTTGLDFHHWDYDDDTGCYLCEPCHITVHGGSDWWHTATDVRGKSNNWRIKSVENLVKKHLEHHPAENSVAGIVDRYNMPDDEDREFDLLVEHALERLENSRSVDTGTKQEASRG